MNFIDACLNGEVLQDDIDTYIEQWSDGIEGINQDLHDYLGMSWDEYSIWGTNPSILPSIIRARRNKVSLHEEIEKEQETLAMAARAPNSLEAAKINKWLTMIGEI